MKYISIGCTEYSSIYGSTCGLGAGWITTDLFDFNSNKHGFGIYVTKVGKENDVTFENGKYLIRSNEYYAAGISYTYFMNGIDKSGFTFGGSIHAKNAKHDESLNGFLQVGYQF